MLSTFFIFRRFKRLFFYYPTRVLFNLKDVLHRIIETNKAIFHLGLGLLH